MSARSFYVFFRFFKNFFDFLFFFVKNFVFFIFFRIKIYFFSIFLFFFLKNLFFLFFFVKNLFFLFFYRKNLFFLSFLFIFFRMHAKNVFLSFFVVFSIFDPKKGQKTDFGFWGGPKTPYFLHLFFSRFKEKSTFSRGKIIEKINTGKIGTIFSMFFRFRVFEVIFWSIYSDGKMCN